MEHDIKLYNTVKKNGNNVYIFNKGGVYFSMTLEQIKEMNVLTKNIMIEEGSDKRIYDKQK